MNHNQTPTVEQLYHLDEQPDLTNRIYAAIRFEEGQNICKFNLSGVLEIGAENTVDMEVLIVKHNAIEYSIAITAKAGDNTIGYMDFYIRDYDTELRGARGGGNFVRKGIASQLISDFELDYSIRLNSELDPNNSLNVLPEFQGKGVGKELLFMCLRLCQALGADMFMVRDTTYPDYLQDHYERSYYAKFLHLVPGSPSVIFPVTQKAVEYFANYGMTIRES